MRQGKFKLHSEYTPAGDQPNAIEGLVRGLENGHKHQTLLGATGTGKTYTVANVIERVQKPTLVIAHNKTLAAQLAREYQEFFPENAVHYFVSYYDYYQPEAYVPVTDTYIEKEAQINKEIDRLRHAATQALLTRNDVIIVASVSCIYGLGSPEEYERENLRVEKGGTVNRSEFIRKLVGIYYERTGADLEPGMFRAVGNSLEIMPVSEYAVYRIEFDLSNISRISKIDAMSRNVIEDDVSSFFLFPAKHFVTDAGEIERAVKSIKAELADRLSALEKQGKNLEAERLKRRTSYDLALIKEVGYCSGIENYTRHFSGRAPGEPPDTLLSYFAHLPDGTPDFLTIIDESHVTVPQIAGMFGGDRSRKETLIEHGFRLPSAKDNRPLTFDEFDERVGRRIYTSATPADYEREVSAGVVEQIIRPTGLVDPKVFVRPITARRSARGGHGGEGAKGQVADFIDEAEKAIEAGERVLATTLTKKMAEDLSEYLKERGLKTEYLHSDIKTIERIEIITRFRRGEFDCLVGVNLLREGLDLPEVALIGILDADKAGFLRSETSLIQIIGRAARNINGRVILYADTPTGAMESAIRETERRRNVQLAYNKKHGITPQTIKKRIYDITETIESDHERAVSKLTALDKATKGEQSLKQLVKKKEAEMQAAVKELDFETAAILRDEIRELRKADETSTA